MFLIVMGLVATQMFIFFGGVLLYNSGGQEMPPIYWVGFAQNI